MKFSTTMLEEDTMGVIMEVSMEVTMGVTMEVTILNLPWILQH
jgi:hypothetical protein